MVKRLATSPHDPLGITDSACKNQSVVVSVRYGPFNPYIPIRSTTIDKSRVARDPIAMHTSWRSNSDIASVTRLRCEVPCFIGREHCDVLSMQIDSDLVIYRTALVRTFQVVTICRVDKSEVLVVLISPHDSKRH
ncbi:putative LRR receptor-like serine/threonine-protein kinase [Dorcoceras hygrometricum]|uniref:Putative LRR receptor-like serine/threonine-protein kinase n=1 Tax=Dorcoceras hygrometricum TaxID=472368 RepID=A0A2Z7CSA1_9LAMI|nr:putative LRR receptor-like serine/threonine-protein kinase [Dorcoceras hygrometricum]